MTCYIWTILEEFRVEALEVAEEKIIYLRKTNGKP